LPVPADVCHENDVPSKRCNEPMAQ
jgi:hypothetical protein